MFLGLIDLFESLARNTRALDSVQRSVNMLLSDRDRLLDQLRHTMDAVSVDAPGALIRLFGDEVDVLEFLEFQETVTSLMPADQFHVDLPPADHSFDSPEAVAGPSGTYHDADDEDMVVEGEVEEQEGDDSGEA